MKTILSLELQDFITCAKDQNLEVLDDLVIYIGNFLDAGSLKGADPSWASSSIVAQFETAGYLFEYHSDIYSIERGLDPEFSALVEQLWSIKETRRMLAVNKIKTWDNVLDEHARILKR